MTYNCIANSHLLTVTYSVTYMYNYDAKHNMTYITIQLSQLTNWVYLPT